MKRVGEVAGNFRVGMMPQFTIVHHPIRKKYGLTQIQYAVIDSVDQLSNNPNYPYCVLKKEDLAEWLGASRSSVFDALKMGIELGLIEKQEGGSGVRSTEKWLYEVRLYDDSKGR
ncbi:MAG: hypothetical protein AAGF25_00475 [Pseudomonadota bacterium]